MTKPLEKPSRAADRARVKRRPKGWSPERRARQAALIRSSKPWHHSTGPKTEAGKARSAANALKHGFRSRAHLETVREDRHVLRLSARTIAIAKALLRTRSANAIPNSDLPVSTNVDTWMP